MLICFFELLAIDAAREVTVVRDLDQGRQATTSYNDLVIKPHARFLSSSLGCSVAFVVFPIAGIHFGFNE